MQTHNLAQGSPEWHAHRAHHFNASDAPAMLGCSPYMTRTQLLQALHAGMRPEPDAPTQRRFDDGHRTEALARPLAEAIIGEELYPVVGSEGELSASFDGLTMAEDANWECKRLNQELRAALPNPGPDGNDAATLAKAYRVQMEQQSIVSGCARVLFTAAQFDAEGNLIEARHCWYTPDPALRAEILSGWKQFAADLAVYVPVEVLDRPAAVGHSPDQLPALRSSVKGELVLESNIKEWEEAALAYIKSVREHDLKTDEDFANADAAAKWCDTSKASLNGVRSQLMGATGDVNLAVATLDRIVDELDKTRIAFSNAIKARKEARKAEIVASGGTKLREHVAALNRRLGMDYMPIIAADFAGAIRGKSSLTKMEDAVASELARAKIAANEMADRIQANRDDLKPGPGAIPGDDWIVLFPDFAQVCTKPTEDFHNVRIARVEAERQRREAERERIRKEEADRIQREQEATAKREREAEEAKARQATQAPVAAPAPAVVPSATPASAPQAAAANSPNVVPMQRAAAPSEQPTLSLGDMNTRLGFTMNSAFVRQLGIVGTPGPRAGVSTYRESEFELLCEALKAHITTVQAKQLQAA